MNTARKLTIVSVLLLSGGCFCLAQSSSPSRASSSATPASASSTTSTTTASSSASTGAPYTEGSVWDITMVRTRAGMGDDYIKNLAKNYKVVMEEQKKQNLVLNYKILLGDAANSSDYDMLLMVEFKNMAAMDGLREKTDPIALKVAGGEEQQKQGSVKRAEVREILGSKTMREITLK